jgi:hypothetical protein
MRQRQQDNRAGLNRWSPDAKLGQKRHSHTTNFKASTSPNLADVSKLEISITSETV